MKLKKLKVVEFNSEKKLLLKCYADFYKSKTTLISGGNTFVNVYSVDHQRSAGSVVRLRGAPQVIASGTGGADTPNLQSFAAIPTISGVTDIDSATGFTIQLGRIAADGTVSGATTTDSFGIGFS